MAPSSIPAPTHPTAPPLAAATTPLVANPKVQHEPLCTMYVGPGMELHGFMDACQPAVFYMRRKMGQPGGAICNNSIDMASCPHFDA